MSGDKTLLTFPKCLLLISWSPARPCSTATHKSLAPPDTNRTSCLTVRESHITHHSGCESLFTYGLTSEHAYHSTVSQMFQKWMMRLLRITIIFADLVWTERVAGFNVKVPLYRCVTSPMLSPSTFATIISAAATSGEDKSISARPCSTQAQGATTTCHLRSW